MVSDSKALDPVRVELMERLVRIEEVLQTLLREKAIKEWYSTAEVAALVGKAEFTVREWCRKARIRARKKSYSRGAHAEWLISHEDLQYFRNHGLLPISSNA